MIIFTLLIMKGTDIMNDAAILDWIDISFQGYTDESGSIALETKLNLDKNYFLYSYKVIVPVNYILDNSRSIQLSCSDNHARFYPARFSNETELLIRAKGKLIIGEKRFVMGGSGFKPKTEINIEARLIFLKRNISRKTNELLRECKSDSILNPLCIGLSEHSFLNTLSNLRFIKEFKIPQTSSYVEIRIDGNDELTNVKIKPDSESIEFHALLHMFFYQGNKMYASVDILFEIDVEPIMITRTKNTFSLKINYVKSPSIINKEIIDITIIIEEYGSQEKFEVTLQDMFDKIKDSSNNNSENESINLNELLPNIITFSLPIDDIWNIVEGCKIEFQRFYYKKGSINDNEVGLLFLVFSIHSLKIPKPCIDLDSELVNSQSLSDLNLLNIKEFYQKLMDESITLGISTDALTEVLFPILNQYYTNSKEDNIGIIHGSIGYWTKTVFKDVSIDKGIVIEMELLEAGGAINAWLEKYGIKTKKISRSISIGLEDVDIRLIFRESSGYIWVEPKKVSIGRLNVDIDGSTPYPLNEIENLLVDFIERPCKDAFELYLNTFLILRIIKVPTTNRYQIPELQDIDYYANESVVFTLLQDWQR